MHNSNYGRFFHESYSGTGTFEVKDQSKNSDEDLDDTIRIREISFMSMYPGEDSISGDNLGVDEFGNLRKYNFEYH